MRQLRNTTVHKLADLKPGQRNGALAETEELLTLVSSERDTSAED